MSPSADATLVRGAIHNPKEPRHFMRIVPTRGPATAVAGGVELARSTRAVKVKEVGLDIYDPVIYFPREDVAMDRLVRTEKTTHCPLKGDTEYFDAPPIESAAWSYARTIDEASELKGLVAFDSRLVIVTEEPA